MSDLQWQPPERGFDGQAYTREEFEAEMATERRLKIIDLGITFATDHGDVRAVDGVSLFLDPGEILALVGESGSGKSTTAHAIIDLLPGTGKVTAGSIMFDGVDVTKASKREIVALRGKSIGLVPQDPMSNLNPVWSIGFQVKEGLRANGIDVSRGTQRKLALGLAESEGLQLAGGDLLLSHDAKRTLIEQAGRKEIYMLLPLVFMVLPLSVLVAVFPGIVMLRLGLG